jgi:hypothetical protein
LDLSGQAYDSEGPVGDGRYDLHFISSAGDDDVVEIKYVKASDDENKAKNYQANKPSKVNLKQIARELAIQNQDGSSGWGGYGLDRIKKIRR